MEFDIIEITEEELKKLSPVSMKMLRTAQQKKDELLKSADDDFEMFKRIVLTNGMKSSSLLADKRAELDEECARQIAILADNLLYNMSLNEPTDDDLGGGDESAGYIVDYSLPYNQRYAIVRNYYLSIQDPQERMALYSADEVAKKYLASYYGTLYDVLYTYSQ